MNYYDNQRNIAESLRKMYPKGTRVECINMDDPYSPVPPGTKGTVCHVDDRLFMQVGIVAARLDSCTVRTVPANLRKKKLRLNLSQRIYPYFPINVFDTNCYI